MLGMDQALESKRKTRAEWARERRTKGHRSRLQPNKLRDWLERKPRPMTKARFAELIGCSGAYVSILLADDPPWPGRPIARLIGIITLGEVTPNDLAGYPPDD